jgi:hypothetical protein
MKDLNKKISSAGGKLSETVAELKMKPQPPAGSTDSKELAKGKGKKSNFPGVEMSNTVLTGPVKDGYVFIMWQCHR